jgi:hypothetical protein
LRRDERVDIDLRRLCLRLGCEVGAERVGHRHEGATAVLDDLGGGEGVAAAAGFRSAGGQRLRGGRAGEGGESEGDSEGRRAHPALLRES